MFIISPRGGLCNQLQTIVKGMLLAKKYNRNLYIDKFMIHYSKSTLVDINKILNIAKMNEFLINNNFNNFKILENFEEDNFNKYYMKNVDYDKIKSMIYINNYIEENLNMDIIYLGNIVMLQIYESFNYLWSDNNNLYFLFMKNIIFKDIFYEIRDKIKENLDLKLYNCAHLRIEDDCIQYCAKLYKISEEEYNNKLLSFYSDKIQKFYDSDSDSKLKIYICSGILNFDNKINYEYYQNLKLKYGNSIVDKNDILDQISNYNYILENRELIAIVDLLIAFDSDQFIGNHFSSFSIYVGIYKEYFNKNSNVKLFNFT